jgi:hypothetical protein
MLRSRLRGLHLLRWRTRRRRLLLRLRTVVGSLIFVCRNRGRTGTRRKALGNIGERNLVGARHERLDVRRRRRSPRAQRDVPRSRQRHCSRRNPRVGRGDFQITHGIPPHVVASTVLADRTEGGSGLPSRQCVTPLTENAQTAAQTHQMTINPACRRHAAVLLLALQSLLSFLTAFLPLRFQAQIQN